MKVNYTVHTVSEETAPVEVTVDGVKMLAQVPVMVVELVSVDPLQKNPLLYIPASEVDKNRDLFVPDAKITATFAATTAASTKGA